MNWWKIGYGLLIAAIVGVVLYAFYDIGRDTGLARACERAGGVYVQEAPSSAPVCIRATRIKL